MDKLKLQGILTRYGSGKLKDDEAIEKICALADSSNENSGLHKHFVNERTLMKEVIKYLERLRSNIESIAKLRREHKFLLDIIEKEKLLTNDRIKQFRGTNNKVSEVIVDELFLNAL